ncbi:hypothetical protein KAFR_0D00840 [Kazachstania africana CBS 2517]|uniref:Uncharacterized protein n=1 Tax=Kazachstania africana (strain ATCC 22294 / BCRC 22015 / CBS 2517 / CECT 1963 / NBRC 1671 / NRRL Y-8276) TaxID=1071382 RepID=H2ATN1_KAZAF|nr:hypothetical protein KAFR_0D00840 [Kazachstania africana CBS 2517]CCF57731.1 hypothetical protein KAFR_0D00840 [Kazachstania africana CBS 2517]
MNSNKLLLRYSKVISRNLRNVPKFDDSEILAQKVNLQDFKSKRSNFKKLPGDKSINYRNVIIRRLNFLKVGFITAVFTATAAGSAFYLYRHNYENKSMIEDSLVKPALKKKKKKLSVPFIPLDSELGLSVPGLYYWGDRDFQDESWTGIPKRVKLFDGMILKDVCLVNDRHNLVIDKNGDLFNWEISNERLKLVLSRQNLVHIKESNNCCYALNGKGQILVIPLKEIDNLTDKFIKYENITWFNIPWLKRARYNLVIDTSKIFDRQRKESKIIQFDTGENHLALVSNVGKAYTCSTGYSSNNDSKKKSFGQFGLPNFSQFDNIPPTNELFEVELLNNIVKMSCGKYHTLAIDSQGNLFTFGLNRNGQLGFLITYENEFLPYPRMISNRGIKQYFTGNRDTLSYIDINCCSETSFITVLNPITKQINYFSFGNGLNGELGNGHFKNSEFEPKLIKFLQDTNVTNWICNKDSNHIFVTTTDGIVKGWGLNDRGQIGTVQKTKKYKISQPITIPSILEPGIEFEKNLDSLLKLDGTRHKLSVGKESSCLYCVKN